MNNRFWRYVVYFWLLILLAITIPSCLVALVANEFFGKLPDFKELENPQSNLASEIYSSDQRLLGKYYVENRSNTKYEDLSPNLINALIAAEDIRFETHSGVDIRGLMRVAFKTIVLRQNAGGGSTISQQLAKNLFPRKSFQTVSDKIVTKFKEWVTAVKLERSYTKKEIMTMYLNTVPFGSNAYGVKSAARIFFDTAPDSVKPEEAAILIGLLKAPTYYSPIRNPENAKKRRDVVLYQMAKYDFINDAESDSLKNLPIELRFQSEDHIEGPAPYFREYLRGILMEWCNAHKKPDGTKYNLYKDGLKIYTTIDSRMQKYAEQSVSEHLGGELQSQFFNHWKGKKNAPFDASLSQQDINSIMMQAVKSTHRHSILAGIECSSCGRRGSYVMHIEEDGVNYYQCRAEDCQQRIRAVAKDSIDIIFTTPIKMKIFSWKGEIDTIMSPMDSILYYKFFLRSGFMAMDPHTGHVKAWVGGINYKHFKYDQVKLGRRQVGSTFKPFVYTLAMQEKWSPCIEIPNVPITFTDEEGKDWTPRNSDDGFDDLKLSLKFGLANSINTMTAYVMKQFSPEAVINMARKMGIESPMEPYPALCLGVSDLTVYEMVGAYSTFANRGIHIEPLVMTRIEDNKGNVLYEFTANKVESMNEETAYLMLNMIQGVVDGVYSPAAGKKIGTGVRLRFKYKFTNQIAGKTGTTQNYSDGWFMGITPNLVSGVWVGCEDRSVHFRSMSLGQGANMALPVWAIFMKKVYADKSLGISEKDVFETIASKKLGVELDCEKYRQMNGNYSEHNNQFE